MTEEYPPEDVLGLWLNDPHRVVRNITAGDFDRLCLHVSEYRLIAMQFDAIERARKVVNIWRAFDRELERKKKTV